MDTDKTLVIGIGNRLVSDDGAGPAVLERLKDDLPDGSRIELTTPGYDLLTHLEGRERVFIVDAARFGGRPGEVRRTGRAELNALEDGPEFSSHGLGLLGLLEMAEKTGLLAQPAVLYLIQAENLEPGQGLSPAAAAGVEEAVRRIREEL